MSTKNILTKFNFIDTGSSGQMFDECPFCHKLFAVEEVSKEQIDSDLVTPTIKVPRIAQAAAPPMTYSPTVASGHKERFPRPDDVRSEDFITYKVTYRCKHCSKEWSKLSKQVVKIPHGYVKAEGEKTEADAEREIEMAREEDYARDEK